MKRQKELLESIPSIGKVTINVVLSEFADISRFDTAKQLASFIGLALAHRLSGTSVRVVGHPCLKFAMPKSESHFSYLHWWE